MKNSCYCRIDSYYRTTPSQFFFDGHFHSICVETMLSIRRTASLITKVRVSSGKRAFGAPAGGHGHDHADDHAHHDHPVS